MLQNKLKLIRDLKSKIGLGLVICLAFACFPVSLDVYGNTLFINAKASLLMEAETGKILMET